MGGLRAASLVDFQPRSAERSFRAFTDIGGTILKLKKLTCAVWITGFVAWLFVLLVTESQASAKVTFSQLTNSTGFGIDSPSIAADGTRIAFTSSGDLTPGAPGNLDGNSELFLADVGKLNIPTIKRKIDSSGSILLSYQIKAQGPDYVMLDLTLSNIARTWWLIRRSDNLVGVGDQDIPFVFLLAPDRIRTFHNILFRKGQYLRLDAVKSGFKTTDAGLAFFATVVDIGGRFAFAIPMPTDAFDTSSHLQLLGKILITYSSSFSVFENLFKNAVEKKLRDYP